MYGNKPERSGRAYELTKMVRVRAAVQRYSTVIRRHLLGLEGLVLGAKKVNKNGVSIADTLRSSSSSNSNDDIIKWHYVPPGRLVFKFDTHRSERQVHELLYPVGS